MNYILGKGQHRRYINSLAEQDFLLCPKFYTIKKLLKNIKSNLLKQNCKTIQLLL